MGFRRQSTPVDREAPCFVSRMFCFALCLGSPAFAQEWAEGYHTQGIGPLASTQVKAMATFDDGTGDALYVAGVGIGVAGAIRADGLVRLRGDQFQRVGTGKCQGIEVLHVHDDGSGLALYVGGSFATMDGVLASSVARFDGNQFTPLGAGLAGTVLALASFDSGSGSQLYAGGWFAVSPSPTLVSLARFDGTQWHAVPNAPNGEVRALAVYSGGVGSRLYCGGSYTACGPLSAASFARFDGFAWDAAGGGLNGPVNSLVLHDEGAGERLCIAGHFFAAGYLSSNIITALSVARFDGSQYSAIGTGSPQPVHRLFSLSDGPTRRLFGCGFGLQFKIGFWNGTSWVPLVPTLAVQPTHHAMANYAGSGGNAIYASGHIQLSSGTITNAIARYQNGAWSAAGTTGLGIESAVTSLGVDDDGEEQHIHVGTRALISSSPSTQYGVLRFLGNTWSQLGLSMSRSPSALAGIASGPLSGLYAGFPDVSFDATGAGFGLIARWNGSAWTKVGTPTILSVSVRAMTRMVDSSGDHLYVGGLFDLFGSVPLVKNIAKWNGAAWSGLGANPNGNVEAMTTFDDGTGIGLYVGGQFASVGAQTMNGIACYRNGSWSALGSGLASTTVYPPRARALAVHDDGHGPQLYVGGLFNKAGGIDASHLARFDGSNWQAVSTSGIVVGDVVALAAFDDGSGPALFAAGHFAAAPGSQLYSSVIRFDGVQWEFVDLEIDQDVNLLAITEAPTRAVWAAGDDVWYAGPHAARNIVPWLAGPPAIAPYGTGCPGAGGFVPQLVAAGAPHPGGRLRIELEGGLGGSSAVLLVGSGQAALGLGGGCTFLLSGMLPIPITVPLLGSGPGLGTFEIPAIVPLAIPSLTLTLQAFSLDAASPIGAAASNGVRIVFS